MAKVIPITERFQHFVEELKESFWGDLYGRTRAAWKKFFELDSERLRDRHAGWNRYRRGSRKPGGYRNGCRSIVESHGGRLWATCDNPPGATFHFTLPIEAAAHQAA